MLFENEYAQTSKEELINQLDFLSRHTNWVRRQKKNLHNYETCNIVWYSV